MRWQRSSQSFFLETIPTEWIIRVKEAPEFRSSRSLSCSLGTVSNSTVYDLYLFGVKLWWIDALLEPSNSRQGLLASRWVPVVACHVLFIAFPSTSPTLRKTWAFNTCHQTSSSSIVRTAPDWAPYWIDSGFSIRRRFPLCWRVGGCVHFLQQPVSYGCASWLLCSSALLPSPLVRRPSNSRWRPPNKPDACPPQ